MGNTRLQSAYDGAALVYGRNQALAYMGNSDPPGHAAITTFTTDGTNLNMYAHYANPSEKDPRTLEYHQHQCASTNIKDSYQGHRRPKRSHEHPSLRKGSVLRPERPTERILGATEHTPFHRHRTLPTRTRRGAANATTAAYEEPAPYDDDVNADNYEIVTQPCQPTPAASTESCNASRSHASSRRSHHSSEGGRKRKASPPSHASSRP